MLGVDLMSDKALAVIAKRGRKSGCLYDDGVRRRTLRCLFSVL